MEVVKDHKDGSIYDTTLYKEQYILCIRCKHFGLQVVFSKDNTSIVGKIEHYKEKQKKTENKL